MVLAGKDGHGGVGCVVNNRRVCARDAHKHLANRCRGGRVIGQAIQHLASAGKQVLLLALDAEIRTGLLVGPEQKARQRQGYQTVGVQVQFVAQSEKFRRHGGIDMPAVIREARVDPARSRSTGFGPRDIVHQKYRRRLHRLKKPRAKQLRILCIKIVPPKSLHRPGCLTDFPAPGRPRVGHHVHPRRIGRVREAGTFHLVELPRPSPRNGKEMIHQVHIRQVEIAVVGGERHPEGLLGIVVHVVIAMPGGADVAEAPVGKKPRTGDPGAQGTTEKIKVLIPEPLEFGIGQADCRAGPILLPHLPGSRCGLCRRGLIRRHDHCLRLHGGHQPLVHLHAGEKRGGWLHAPVQNPGQDRLAPETRARITAKRGIAGEGHPQGAILRMRTPRLRGNLLRRQALMERQSAPVGNGNRVPSGQRGDFHLRRRGPIGRGTAASLVTVRDQMDAVEQRSCRLTLLILHLHPNPVPVHVHEDSKRYSVPAAKEIDLADTGGDIQPMPEEFRLASVKTQDQRPAGERTRVEPRIVVAHQAGIFREPGILARLLPLPAQFLHAAENLAELSDLFTVPLRHADIPDIIMAESQHHGIRPGADHNAQPAVPQQGPGEKIGCGAIPGDRI